MSVFIAYRLFYSMLESFLLYGIFLLLFNACYYAALLIQLFFTQPHAQ